MLLEEVKLKVNNVRGKMDLILVELLGLVFLTNIYVNIQNAYLSNIMIVISLFFLILFPGYIFLVAFFDETLNLAEKIALSAPLSIAIVEILGLFLNWTLGINLLSFTAVLFLIISILFLVSVTNRTFKRPPRSIIDKSGNPTGNFSKDLKYLILLVLLSLPFFVYLKNIGISFEYIYRHWAFVEFSRNLDYMNPFAETGGYTFDFVSLYPGHDIFLISLAKFSGLPIIVLQYLPLAGISIVCVYYLLFKKFTNSENLALILSIATVPFDISYSLQVYMLHYYSMNILFYLTFLYFLIQYLESRREIFIFPAIILFIGSVFVHHRAPIWMILTVGAVVLFTALSSWLLKLKFEFKLKYLLLFFVVTYLTFNQVIYKQYLPKITEIGGIEGFDTFFRSIESIFLGRESHIEKYMYPPSASFLYSFEYNIFSLIKVIIIFIPVFIYVVTILVRIPKKGENIGRVEFLEILVLAQITTFFCDVFIYLLLGRPSLIFYYIAMPLISIFAVRRLFSIKLCWVFVLLLLTLSAFKFIFLNSNPSYMAVSYSGVESASSWLMSVADFNYTITGDFRLFGMFLVMHSEKGRFPGYIPFSSNTYSDIVEGREIPKSFFVLSKKDLCRPVVSMFWWYFEPLCKYYSEINLNRHLNKIYTDEKIEIYSAY